MKLRAEVEQKISFSKLFFKVIIGILALIGLVSIIGINLLGFYVGDVIYQQASIVYGQENKIQQPQRRIDQMNDGIKNRGWENVLITSPYGYSLQGTYIKSSKESTETVIFLHGFTQSRLSGLSYLPIYQRLGMNVLLVDSRANGESGGRSVTWGVKEQDDVDAWIDWLARNHPVTRLGIHGISMGGATALLHAEKHAAAPRADFYIADSSYTALEPLLKKKICQRIEMSDGGLLYRALYMYANLAAWYHDGCTYADAEPIKHISTVTVPVLYMHGTADELVQPEMSDELYGNTASKIKQLEKFKASGHAMGIYDQPKQYERIINEFLNRVRKSDG